MKKLILLIGLFAGTLHATPVNILMIIVDDMSADSIGAVGAKLLDTTPNIDRLAKQGVKFTNAYATCHVCSPTRASIMTGKYPGRLDLTDWLSGRP